MDNVWDSTSRHDCEKVFDIFITPTQSVIKKHAAFWAESYLLFSFVSLKLREQT